MQTSLPSDSGFPALDSIQFSSIAGIIIATTVIVAVLKRFVGDKPVFRKVPAFAYVTAISLILTFLANRVFKTLPGTIGVLLWDAAKAALASSGFYTWVTGRAGPIEEVSNTAVGSVPRMRAGLPLLLLFTVMLTSGCITRPELVSLREGMDRSTATIRKQHLEWAAKLAEGKQGDLPTLSNLDYRAVLIAHREYQDLVNSSRAQDHNQPTTQPKH